MFLRLVFLWAIIFPLLLWGQDNKVQYNSFDLKIAVENKDTGTLTLHFLSAKDIIPSSGTVVLKNGMAQIRGSLKNGVSEALIFTKKADHLDDPSIARIIVEPGNVEVKLSITSDSAHVVDIRGSNSEKEHLKWLSENKTLLSTNHRPSILKSALVYIDANPNSLFSAYLLQKYKTWMSIDSLKNYYLKLGQEARYSSFGRYVSNRLYTLADQNFRDNHDLFGLDSTIKTINSLHDVSLPDTNNISIQLSKYKGNIVLLFFWASWCMPCKKQIPYLKKINEQIQDLPIKILSISVDEDKEAWLKAVKQYDPPGTNLLDTKSLLRYYYRFLFVPHLIIVDKKGQIINADAPGANNPKLFEILKSDLPVE
ncbi:MAG: TlpA disulfide reductase family protein [Niabella sp.]